MARGHILYFVFVFGESGGSRSSKAHALWCSLRASGAEVPLYLLALPVATHLETHALDEVEWKWDLAAAGGFYGAYIVRHK
jgi:hypothetical protein